MSVPNAKTGIRKDLGICFRSSWEANYARILKSENKEELETNVRLMLLFHASDSLKHWSKHKKLGDLKIAEKGFDYFYKLIEKL